MKLSVILTAFFTNAWCATSPISNIGLREYMARGIGILTQRRLINAGFHRKTKRKQGKAIAVKSLMETLKKAQQAADTFEKMMAKVNTYKF